jgi:D-lactate dehydrogenase
MVLAISWLGTRRLPAFFAAKRYIDGLCERSGLFPSSLSDRVLQWIGQRLPSHLPPRIRACHRDCDHHLLLLVEGADAERYAALLRDFFADQPGDYFGCTPAEQERAMLHRFAVAGAAVRYRDLHKDEVEDIVALDVALRRNDTDWDDALPADVQPHLAHALFYGHFFCHVFHRDYIIAKGGDVRAIKALLIGDIERRGAEYPAEHNVGHLYRAKQALTDFYRQLDPVNAFNPGIGMTSRRKRWKGHPAP